MPFHAPAMSVRLGPAPKLAKKVEKYRVVALSPWRGGTRFLTTWLRVQGVNVQHEGLRIDGGVNPKIWRGIQADIWVHLVRHPLTAIRSLSDLEQEIFKPWASVFGYDEEKPELLLENPEALARIWYHWHHDIDLSLCDRHPTLVRLEHWEQEFPLILRHLGGNGTVVPIDTEKVHGNSLSTGKRRHAPLVWKDLGIMEEPVRRLAATYGYKE